MTTTIPQEASKNGTLMEKVNKLIKTLKTWVLVSETLSTMLTSCFMIKTQQISTHHQMDPNFITMSNSLQSTSRFYQRRRSSWDSSQDLNGTLVFGKVKPRITSLLTI